jgi:hypothetical protein
MLLAYHPTAVGVGKDGSDELDIVSNFFDILKFGQLVLDIAALTDSSAMSTFTRKAFGYLAPTLSPEHPGNPIPKSTYLVSSLGVHMSLRQAL